MVKIESHKVNFKDKAQSKVGSMDNLLGTAGKVRPPPPRGRSMLCTLLLMPHFYMNTLCVESQVTFGLKKDLQTSANSQMRMNPWVHAHLGVCRRQQIYD